MKKINFFSTIIYIAIFYFSLQPAIDPDTGWHLATGKYIYQNHQIPQTDPFSYSLPNHPYIAHSWAFDLISFLLVNSFGILSLSILFALLTTLSIYFISKIATNLIPQNSFHYLTPLIIYPAIEIIGQRPQAFTVLGMSILLYFLTKSEPESNYKIPILFLIWTNFHGGVILGIALLGLWAFSKIISKNSLSNKFLSSKIFIFSFLATLINPYSYHIYIFAYEMITNQTSQIYNSDWVPLFSSSLDSSTLLLRVVIFVSSLLAIFDNHKLRKIQLFSLLFLSLSLKSLRYTVPLLVLVSPLLLITFQKLFLSFPHKKWTTLIPLSLVGIIFYPQLVNKTDLSCSRQPECYALQAEMPYEAVEYLKENNINGNIFDFYTWGGYLSWQLPGSKVFIDGRMDNFFINNQSFLKEFVSIDQMEGDWYKKLLTYNTNLVLVPANWHKHRDLLLEKGWLILQKDDLSILMKK